MTEEYKAKLGVPAEHTLVEISAKREQRHGQDADIYELEERNAAGEVVGVHHIRDTMSIYPPHTRQIIVE
ncbi:hypothetical protein [Pseudomonas sp. Y24-6]|uniref:hypothetical protein n=1 Tax=Pseudomonas sp. Y24-6 TaxID=2750013 RepID=UPI001CE0B468|nr:hypothetical protein [Pseudomonas sp. Y24-6]MCA4964686.1 hypothetical protein [Pseudomonas sp. Y24-6]